MKSLIMKVPFLIFIVAYTRCPKKMALQYRILLSGLFEGFKVFDHNNVYIYLFLHVSASHSGKFDSWVIHHLAITVTQIGAKSELSVFFQKNLLVTNYKVPNVFSTKGCEFFFLDIHFKSTPQQKNDNF